MSDHRSTVETVERDGHEPAAHHRAPVRGTAFALLTLAALGVVFGDLGTSPLYAMREAFHGPHAVAPTRANVLGVLSLFFWSLVLVISVKYVMFIMRADNRGEGGILALLALILSKAAGTTSRTRGTLIALGLTGAALLYGDGVITPAISVLSAVEGLNVATPLFEPYVVPITVAILVGIFAVQPYGSGRVGVFFGPIIAVWFLAIAALGISSILLEPGVFAAVNPLYGVRFFAENGGRGFLVLGAVILCVTGGEALYADMGHFGAPAIRMAWFALALPALVLSYLGQGAELLHDPAAAENPFFHAAPAWALYPLVALATAATVIASQALISAVFSLTRQAMQLEFSPRFKVVHTSATEMGQIYLPGLNWAMMLATIALVVGFRSSSRLAAAYGLAVAGTMAVTTILFAYVARAQWRWPLAAVVLFVAFFLSIDLAFLGANVLKIPDGGWLPLVMGGAVYLVMTTWSKGRRILHEAIGAKAPSLDVFIASVAKTPIHRSPGTAVFLTGTPGKAPDALRLFLRHTNSLDERVVLLHITTVEVPTVEDAERVTYETLGAGFFRIVARYGFMEDRDVPHVLRLAALQGFEHAPEELTYFLSRATVIASERPGMAIWREKFFGVMYHNALDPAAFFGLPPEQVVELGTQVEI
jgi:KUP system potassium uptake protein